MNIFEKKVYITEDGKQFDSYTEALEHDKKEFADYEAFMEFVRGTDIWKDWEKQTDITDMHILNLAEAVDILANKISSKYPKIYVAGREISVRNEIWKRMENKAVIEYFRGRTSIDIPDEKILKLFACARGNAEDRSFDGFVTQFEDYIEALEIVLGEE